MAVQEGVNSFISLADAETYFASRIDSTNWSEASESDKDSALITAASQLNLESYVGIISADIQTMAFPRDGEYFEPFFGKTIDLPTDIPKRMKDANCEMALHLLDNDGVLAQSGGLEEIKVSSITLKGLDNIAPSSISDIDSVYSIIYPLTATGAENNSVTTAGNAWWRNN